MRACGALFTRLSEGSGAATQVSDTSLGRCRCRADVFRPLPLTHPHGGPNRSSQQLQTPGCGQWLLHHTHRALQGVDGRGMAQGSGGGGRGTQQAIHALVGTSGADNRLLQRAKTEVLDAGASPLATSRHLWITHTLSLSLSEEPQSM